MFKQVIPFAILCWFFVHAFFMWINPKEVVVDSIFPVVKKVEKIDRFTRVSLFFTKELKPYINFNADAMEVFNQERGILENTKATVHYNDTDFHISSRKGSFELGSVKNLELEEDVKIFSINYELTCDKGQYDIQEKKFLGSGNVQTVGVNAVTGDKITVQGDSIIAYPLKKKSVIKNVTSGVIQRKRVYEGKVVFSAKKLDLDFNNSRVDLEDEVKFKRNNISSHARKASIFLENFNKKLNYYEMNGDVVINQRVKNNKTGGFINRKAYAENLRGSVREKKIVLTGSPRVKSENDLIRGSKITLRENASIIEVQNSTAQIDLKDK